MVFFSEKNLTKWIVALPIIGIIMTAVFFVVTGISIIKAGLEKEIQTTQNKLLKEHKQAAQKRVENIVTYLNSSKKMLEKEAKEVTKNTVSLAVNMIENTYKIYSYLSKQEILTKIKK